MRNHLNNPIKLTLSVILSVANNPVLIVIITGKSGFFAQIIFGFRMTMNTVTKLTEGPQSDAQRRLKLASYFHALVLVAKPPPNPL